MLAYSPVDNDETIVCHHMDISDEKAPLAHANRIVFQTELYCFAQDDMMGHRPEREIEEGVRPGNARERYERNGTAPRRRVRKQRRKMRRHDTKPRVRGCEFAESGRSR